MIPKFGYFSSTIKGLLTSVLRFAFNKKHHFTTFPPLSDSIQFQDQSHDAIIKRQRSTWWTWFEGPHDLGICAIYNRTFRKAGGWSSDWNAFLFINSVVHPGRCLHINEDCFTVNKCTKYSSRKREMDPTRITSFTDIKGIRHQILSPLKGGDRK